MTGSEPKQDPVQDENGASLIEQQASKVDDDVAVSNQPVFGGVNHYMIAALCLAYSVFHLMVMNVAPMETWAYRLSHIGGGLALGYLIFGATSFGNEPRRWPFPRICGLRLRAFC